MSGMEWANLAAAAAVSGAANSLWLGLPLAGLAAGMLRLLPRANPATRYAVWFTALVLVLAAPALFLIPRPAPGGAAMAAAATQWSVPVTARWPLYAMLVWVAIAGALLARIALSLAHIQGLKRRATRLGKRDDILVLASAEVQVPMAAGFWRRAIVFPQSMIGELSAAEFEQVLCHELAHLRRWDDWTQLAQETGRAVFFFHPAVHWIGRRLAIEREMACDDWVVAATGQARPYASCLTHLHELIRRPKGRAAQLAPGAATRSRGQIVVRVEALLKPGRTGSPRLSRAGWAAACVLAAAALTAAVRTKPPVGVQELPVARMAMARLAPPPAPAISRAPRWTAAARRMAAPAEASYVLARAWRVDLQPTYMVITVVFFEPPPRTAWNGI